MVKVRCFRCGNAFQMTEQYIANALAAEGITGKPAHYSAECPRCRRAATEQHRGDDTRDNDTGNKDVKFSHGYGS